MLGIKRILCPTDFSEYAHRALAHAIAVAKWTNAEITVLHAVPLVYAPPLAVPAPTPPIPLDAAAKERIEKDLQAFAAPAERARVPVRTQLVEGDPVGEILDTAERGQADLIVMGTHGARGFERFVLGSVTEKVLRKCSCPVMTIPRGEPDATSSEFLFQTILCPVDFSECSAGALRSACELAKETGGRLVVLHVLDWLPPEDPRTARVAPEERDAVEQSAREKLHALLPSDAPPVEQIVRAGRSYREIVRLADETSTGLIVMGVQGRGAIDLMLFGSTTHHVIREARCPVLTVRAPRTAQLEARVSEAIRAPSESPVATGAAASSTPA
jgi:nucleotide-binding universal stress UspA family protein